MTMARLPVQLDLENYPLVDVRFSGDTAWDAHPVLTSVSSSVLLGYAISPMRALIQAARTVSTAIANELTTLYTTGKIEASGDGSFSDPHHAGATMSVSNGVFNIKGSGFGLYRRAAGSNDWYDVSGNSTSVGFSYVLNRAGAPYQIPTSVNPDYWLEPIGFPRINHRVISVRYFYGAAKTNFGETSTRSYWSPPSVWTSQGLMPQPPGITETITRRRLIEILNGANSEPRFLQDTYFYSIKTLTDVPNTLAAAKAHTPELVLPIGSSGNPPLRYQRTSGSTIGTLFEDRDGTDTEIAVNRIHGTWTGSDPDGVFIGLPKKQDGTPGQFPTASRGVYEFVYKVQDRNLDEDTCKILLLIYNEGENAFITAPTFAQDRYDYVLELEEPALERTPVPTGHDPFEVQWVSGDLPEGIEMFGHGSDPTRANVKMTKGGDYNGYNYWHVPTGGAVRGPEFRGTPLHEGTYAIVIRARDVVGDTVDTTLRFQVREAVDPEPPAPEPEPPPPPTPDNPLRWITPAVPDLTYTVGDGILRSLRAASGGTIPISYTLKGHPNWLTFDPTTSVPRISGTVQGDATVYNVTLTATDSADTPASITDEFKITVMALPPVSVPKFARSEYTYTFARGEDVDTPLPEADGGVGTLTYEVVGSPSLPTGVRVTGGKIVGGVGQGAAITSYTFEWRATDTNSASTKTTITVFIVEGAAPVDPLEPLPPLTPEPDPAVPGSGWNTIPNPIDGTIWTADEWRRYIINNMLYLHARIE